MTSILTNTAAMTSLQALTATQRQLSKTQAQISSGLAIASASDGAAYWSISSTMKAQLAGLGASRDGLSLQIDVDEVADTGMQSILKSLSAIKSDIVLARQDGTNRSVVQQDISAQQKQIADLVLDSSFNGVNALQQQLSQVFTYSDAVLSGDQNKEFIEGHPAYQSGPNDHGSSGFPDDEVRDSGQVYLGVLSEGLIETSDNISSNSSAVEIFGTYLTSVLDFTIDGSRSTNSLYAPQPLAIASDADLDRITTGVDRSISILTAVGAGIGADLTTATNLQAYEDSLSDALASGVGSLVDADMNVASTRLQALQTQQQLGIQALSIANQNSQLILKLFGQ